MQALKQAFQDQVQTSLAMGSPFMMTLMGLLPEVLPKASRLHALMVGWTGDVSSRGASLPLRLAGGLHALVRSGDATELARCYPPTLGSGLKVAVEATLVRHEDWLLNWMKLPPQTNEVGRSAVLIAAARFVSARWGLPLRLSELGASAGLNLNFDLYSLAAQSMDGPISKGVSLRPDWTGGSPADVPLNVAERRGVDLSPVDPVHESERLMAYVWPDQTDRLNRLTQALHIAQSNHAPVDKGDAAAWLETRLTDEAPGVCHFVFHTVAFQYFPKETQARIAAAMAKAGSKATLKAPLAWFGMEADGTPHGAALTLRLWPGPEVWALGRAGFHGQWVDWQPKMVHAL